MNNFALLNFHEAAAFTSETSYSKAEEKLAEFLCRIQIHSEKHRELDGAWFRCFDYEKWEYWASGPTLTGAVVYRDRLDTDMDYVGAGPAGNESVSMGCYCRKQHQEGT